MTEKITSPEEEKPSIVDSKKLYLQKNEPERTETKQSKPIINTVVSE